MSSPLWEKCLTHLEGDLSAQQLNTWLRPLQAIETSDSLRLLAPNPYVQAWVQEQLETQINSLIQSLSQGSINVVNIEVGTNIPEAEKVAHTKSTNKEAKVERRREPAPAMGSPINPLFTFDSYVEGKSNQIARAASQHVAEAPGTSGYNPLFLYGGTGLGKTHLMLAVGNKIKKDNPNARVMYLSSERFVQDMITALRNNAIDQFKSHYRSADALLIDDIQFFAKKERSQEEFFYTFNHLCESHHQVVMTSDNAPKELSGLESRLITRLQQGLLVDIKAPDLETRIAILRAKAESDDLYLPDDVCLMIASNIRNSIRELEGALVRLGAEASINGTEITLEMAREALGDMFSNGRGDAVNVDTIKQSVSQYFKITLNEMESKSRARKFAEPRQIAMFLTRKYANKTYPEIASLFGGKDHSTVIHAIRKIEKNIVTNTTLKKQVEEIQQLL